MDTPDTLPLEPLQHALGDRYRLEHAIGAGGMAAVYAAEDTRHTRRVAIKVLRPELAAALGPERFLREIAVAARLHHPHILPLLDSGASQGLFFYVMPLVDGVSLRHRLLNEGALPVDATVRLLREVLDALAYAHAQAIVHRDIKPENVLINGYGSSGRRSHAMIADFGVAKAVSAAAHEVALTATGVTIGTPAYMSPEQATADPNVDHRADLYAVGLLAYEMLAGAPPFAGSTAQHLIAAHLTRTPDRVAAHRPALSPELDEWVMRALEKRPPDRWQTAEEMLARLEHITDAARTPAGSVTVTAAGPAERSFRLTADVCRRLDRQSLDPAIIGGELRFLDNRRAGDVLVYLLHGTGQDHSWFRELASTLPYRCIAPTLVGFEPQRDQRPALALAAHLGIVRELMRDVNREALAAAPGGRGPMVVLVGFSSGGDVALRLVAGADDDPALRADGLISLGCNLGVQTCFVTGLFRRLTGGDESGLMKDLRNVGRDAATLEEWLKIHEYFTGTFRKFGHQLAPVRRFSDDLVRSFEEEPDLFAVLLRTASERVPIVRCVWEGTAQCIELVQQLRLRNLDDPSLFGTGYSEDSLLIEAGRDHFDLLTSAVVRPHLDAVVDAARRLRQ